MDGRGDQEGRARRTVGALVVAALLAVPGVAYAQAALTGDDESGPTAPAVSVVRPLPWQAFRAGAAVDVRADVAGSRDRTCAVRWDDGTDTEAVPATGGGCATSRIMTRPGMYTVSVAATGASGEVTEARTLVVVYDPRSGAVTGQGVTGAPAAAGRFAFEADYVPWRRMPAATGAGAFTAPDGRPAQVREVDWVVVTPERTAAVKGTAVTGDGTAYGFVVYTYDRSGQRSRDAGPRPDRVRLVMWPRSAGDHPGVATIRDDRPGTSYDLDVARPIALAAGAVDVPG
jgi:hypothetical protein